MSAGGFPVRCGEAEMLVMPYRRCECDVTTPETERFGPGCWPRAAKVGGRLAMWLVVDWLKLVGHVPSGFPRYSVCCAGSALAPEQEAAVASKHGARSDAVWAAVRLEAERLGLPRGAWGGGRAADPAAAQGPGA